MSMNDHFRCLTQTRQVDGNIVGACDSRRDIIASLEVQIPVGTSGDGADKEVLLVAVDDGISGKAPCSCLCGSVESDGLVGGGDVGVHVEVELATAGLVQSDSASEGE